MGLVITPDGKYLVTTNDDERDSSLSSLRNTANRGGYSLSVIDTLTMGVISQINTAGAYFVGLQFTGSIEVIWTTKSLQSDVVVFLNGLVAAHG